MSNPVTVEQHVLNCMNIDTVYQSFQVLIRSKQHKPFEKIRENGVLLDPF